MRLGLQSIPFKWNWTQTPYQLPGFPTVTYLDSSVLIGAYFPGDPHHRVCREHLERVVRGEAQAVTSPFTFAEVGGFISRNASPENARRFVLDLARLPHLTVWHAEDFEDFMNTTIALASARGLSGADTIHAVSALSCPGVKEILTLDRGFLKIQDLIPVVLLR